MTRRKKDAPQAPTAGGMAPGDAPSDPVGSSNGASLGGWLQSRIPDSGLSAKVAQVVHVLGTNPRSASYTSASEVAELAGVNIATVTRTAQKLGFAGWPALQQELRARFLLSFSLPDMVAEHSVSGSPASASIRQDVDAVAALSRAENAETLAEIARAVAGASNTYVVALGSYSAVGRALAHNMRIMGYPALLLDEPALMANVVSHVVPTDVLIAVSFWRMYRSTVVAAQQARKRGVKVCAITDSGSSPLAEASDHIVLAPAESVSFFPSMTAGVSAAQALCAELAAIDPERTRNAIAVAEETWDAFGLMEYPRSRRSGTPQTNES